MEELFVLDEKTLQKINKNDSPYLITLNSTKELSFDNLKKIKNKNVTFIIKSALANERYYNNENPKYKNRTIFTFSQTKKIIKCLEKIDKKVAKCSNAKQKALKIYNILLRKIKYEDKKCTDKNGKDSRRTLNSIISRKAVCSGFALIYYEMLTRNNIQNFYIHSQNHLFNVLNFDEKFYPVDLTWETVLKKNTKDNLLHYFGNYPLFEKTHPLLPDEIRIEYSAFEGVVLYKSLPHLKTYKLKRNNGTYFYIAQLPFGEGLKYYVFLDSCSKFPQIITSLEDFDRIWMSKDQTLINCYINILLEHNRVENKLKATNDVGYGYIKNGIFYKKNDSPSAPLSIKATKNSILFQYKQTSYIVTFKFKKFHIRSKKC